MFNNPNLEDIFAGAPDYAEPAAAEETVDTVEETVDSEDATYEGDDVEQETDDAPYEEDESEDVEDDQEYEEEEQPEFDIRNFMGEFGQLLNPQQQQPVNPYMQQPMNPYMQQQQNPYGLQQPQQPQYMLDHMQQMQQQQEEQMRQMQLQSEVATLAQTDEDFQIVAEDFMGVVSENTDLLQMEGGVAVAYEIAKARYVMNNLDNIVNNAVNEYKQSEARKRAAQAPRVTKTAAPKVTEEQSQIDAILGSRPKRLFG